MKRVAIDLTPLLSGGDNGGAKPLAIELTRHLAALAPACEFVLLTNENSHDELALLDAPNVRRLCVTHPANAPDHGRRKVLEVRRLLMKLLPETVVHKIGQLYTRRFDHKPAETHLLRHIEADLLFCPFSGVLFFDPAVPVVSLVHDLQYLYYPEFFDSDARYERDRHFRHLCRVASRVICVSEYTRNSVLQQSDLSPDRVIAIPSAPQYRLAQPEPAARTRVLASLQLKPGRFLLYPANFWRHKNHEILLIAFGMYRAGRPQSDLKLVLTGAPSPRRDDLMDAARRMGLADRVVFPGYLPDQDFAALLAGCAAMVFPSFFEGFGMPVLEAMAASVPVLSSNMTSLPEVAGDAALLFDPRRPAEIVEAVERIESRAELRASLIEQGQRRVKSLARPTEMASRYLEVFREVLRHPRTHKPGIYGVFPDGWTSDCMTVVFDRGGAPRQLTVRLQVPPWTPSAAVSIRVLPDPAGTPEVHRIPRGQEKIITYPLESHPGIVEFLCTPTFQPGRSESGEDFRSLGCRLESAVISGPDGEIGLLPLESHAA